MYAKIYVNNFIQNFEEVHEANSRPNYTIDLTDLSATGFGSVNVWLGVTAEYWSWLPIEYVRELQPSSICSAAEL